MKKSVKISKKTGIALFVTAAVIMALLIVFHKNPGPAVDQSQELAKKIISCVVIAAACFAFIHWYDKFTGLPVELFQNRHLIWKLAKNDFKKRYAGSYLGAVWAMAQPVVTVAMYYIVFDKIMGNTSTPLREGVEVPFVLFLTAGLVPWFYFSEALNNGTNALLEYNYLVKKVVFKISILPIIKIIAATFIHVFFVCLLLIVAAIYGYYPTIYTHLLQFLPVYICAGTQLHHVCGSGVFPGSVPDHQHRIADRHVGHSDLMESGRAVSGVDHDPEAESAGLYREWLPQCDLRERMVFPGFLLHDVFLDRDGGIVRTGCCDL